MLFWFLIKNIGYYIGACFKASFPTPFAPDTTEVLKTVESSVEGHYTVTCLHPETSNVNGTNLPAITLNYVALCVSIHSN